MAVLLEKVTKGSTVEYRHQIEATPGTVAVYVRKSSASNLIYYLHRDHLGSPELITNGSGAQLVKLSFSAYGERRDVDWDGPISSTHLATAANTTRHGYTDHEHLDSVKLIHLGGRVYDPLIGRFLSRDPFIDGMGSSQGANGYAYVWNNPLSNWDPTGYGRAESLDVRNWCEKDVCEPPIVVTGSRGGDDDSDEISEPLGGWLQGLPDNGTEWLLYEYEVAWGAAAAAAAAAPGSEGLTSAASSLTASKSIDPATVGRLLPLASNADRLDVIKLIKGAGLLGAVASLRHGYNQGPEALRYASIDVVVGAGAVLVLGPVVGGTAAVGYTALGGSETVIGAYNWAFGK